MFLYTLAKEPKHLAGRIHRHTPTLSQQRSALLFRLHRRGTTTTTSTTGHIHCQNMHLPRSTRTISPFGSVLYLSVMIHSLLACTTIRFSFYTLVSSFTPLISPLFIHHLVNLNCIHSASSSSLLLLLLLVSFF